MAKPRKVMTARKLEMYYLELLERAYDHKYDHNYLGWEDFAMHTLTWHPPLEVVFQNGGYSAIGVTNGKKGYAWRLEYLPDIDGFYICPPEEIIAHLIKSVWTSNNIRRLVDTGKIVQK